MPDDIAFALVALGHEVLKLREIAPATVPDDDVLRLAIEQACVLITPVTAMISWRLHETSRMPG
ncbi:MAG: DUF5615 family PIN-like protein [Burkholderiales bacterium]